MNDAILVHLTFVSLRACAYDEIVVSALQAEVLRVPSEAAMATQSSMDDTRRHDLNRWAMKMAPSFCFSDGKYTLSPPHTISP